MPLDLSERLKLVIEREVADLQAMDEAAASVRPSEAGSWSPKEEIGHLIDSSLNNHVRFATAAAQTEFRGPVYAQNAWVNLHGYAEMPWNRIVDFWFSANSLLAELIARIPEEKLSVSCAIEHHPPCTLGFLIGDYIDHLQHHLDHALRREEIAPYPPLKAAPETDQKAVSIR